MNYEEETTKYKKKKVKKNPKKTDHEHDYKAVNMEPHIYSNCVFVFYKDKCEICGKEKMRSNFMGLEEFEEFKNKFIE